MITGIDARTGQLTARLDAAAGVKGREVSWDAAEFQGFRHGYAGTIYKGQGKTLDHTYLPAHVALAGGGELRGADAAARERAAVRGDRDGKGRAPAGAADGPGRGAGGVGGVGNGGGAAAGATAEA